MGFLKRLGNDLLRGAMRPSIPPAPHGDNPNLALYVIGFEDARYNGIVKIGVSNNVKKRLDTLQTGCPWRLQAMAITYRSDAFGLENWLHQRFGKYRIRPDGEWFDFGPDSDPVTMIQEA